MRKVFLIMALAMVSSMMFGLDRTAIMGLHQYPVQLVSPNSASTVQINEKTQQLIIKPAATITTLNVLLPVRPIDGQTCGVAATQIVTVMSITATGKTVNNALTTFAAAGAKQTFVFRQADNNWYLIH